MLRFVVLFLSLLAPQLGTADSSGVDSRTEFPPLGCGNSVTGELAGCHFQDANPEVMVTIEGPTEIDVGPEGSGLYTASMPVDTLDRDGAGINAAIDSPNAPGCELEPFAPAGQMKLILDPLGPYDEPVVSHRDDGEPPPVSLVGIWGYQFLVLNCKAPGSLLLRVAMNAFNSSGDEAGEVWNSTTLNVTAVPEPSAAVTGAVASAALAALRRRPAA